MSQAEYDRLIARRDDLILDGVDPDDLAVPLQPIGTKRLRIYFEPRDWWVGVYVAPHAVYICPLPTLVIRWRRTPTGDSQ